MSGGGGDGGGGGVPTDPPNNECQEVYKAINLLSPNFEVLSKIKVGYDLEFEVVQIGNNKSLRVQYEGETAGSIIKYAHQIINCIENDHNYKVVITSLDGASCILDAVKIS